HGNLDARESSLGDVIPAAGRELRASGPGKCDLEQRVAVEVIWLEKYPGTAGFELGDERPGRCPRRRLGFPDDEMLSGHAQRPDHRHERVVGARHEELASTLDDH